MYLKCLGTLQEWVIHSKRKRNFHIDVRPQTVFEIQPPRSPELNPLDFYLWEHLKTLVYSAPNENEETLHQRILMPVKPLATASEPLKGCHSPWSDVSIRALIQVEDVLSICCELWLDKL
jgi:hypothetical protein